jgi:hypothetical protein
MQTAKPNPILRILPSLTDFAFLMPVIFMFTKGEGARTLLGDGDTGWHIRTGEWILANRQVPYKDIFSFTKPGQPWFAWEWGADVIYALLHSRWGLAGVVILSMLILCLTSALLFRLACRRGSNAFIAIGFTFLAVAASSIHWHARPHLFTLLFIVIFLHVLDRVRDGRWKLLYALPPLTLVWVNLHGGFLVGISLLGCYFLGEVLRALLHGDSTTWTRAMRYAAAGAGCGLISLLNPYGYHLHLFIIQYLNAPFLNNISEFMSISFRPTQSRFFEILLAFGFVAAAWSMARRRYEDALVLVAWAHFALTSGRNIPIYGLISAPIAARVLEEWLTAVQGAAVAEWLKRFISRFASIAREFGENDRAWRLHLGAGIVSCVLALAIRDSAPGKLQSSFDPKTFPVNAVSELLKRHHSERVFTLDQWGDYMIYRLYPSVRVYFDGRSDFYGTDFVNQYCDTVNAKYGWNQILSRHDVQHVLLPVDSPLVATLKNSSEWSPVYDDHKAILFDRNSAANISRDQILSVHKREKNRDSKVREREGRDPEVTVGSNRDLRITVTPIKSL